MYLLQWRYLRTGSGIWEDAVHRTLTPIDPAESLRPFLRQAVVQFGDARYRPALDRLGAAPEGDRLNLLYPM